MPFRLLRPILLAALALAAPASAADTRKTVYFIGNSLTMSTTLDRVHGLFGQRGIDLQFGSQLSAGKSLIRHLNYRTESNQKWLCWETCEPSGATFLPSGNFYRVDPATWRFGRYDSALVRHRWDAVVLQPYLSPLKDDLEAAAAFIRLALKHGTAEDFYLYQTWPRRPRPKEGAGPDAPEGGGAENIDYPALWTAEYTASAADSSWKAALHCASRDYTRKLLTALRDALPELKRPIRLIPVGEVLYAIDGKIKRDELPGLRALATREPSMLPGLRPGTGFSEGANVLYADAIHFNPMPHQKGVVGNFISGTTLVTVLSGRSPVGLRAAAYGFDETADAPLVKAIQETIWEVVTADPATGVSR